MVLHIGNNHTIPWRDIIAVLDAKTVRKAHGQRAIEDLDMSVCDSGLVRSIIVCESGGRKKVFGSPISTAALRLRSSL